MRNVLKKGLAVLGVAGMAIVAMAALAPAAGASHDGTPEPFGVYGGKGDNANLKCRDLNDGTEHGGPSLDFGEQSDVPGASFTTRSVPGEPLHIDWTSGDPVGFVIVKQSTNSAVFVVGGATSGTVHVALSDDVRASNQGYSHVRFCTGPSDPEPEPGKLKIAKSVFGTSDWSFDFSGDLGSFTLTDESPFFGGVFVDPGDYTIIETDSSGLVGVDCGDAETTQVAGGVTVTIEAGDVVTCWFTNFAQSDESPQE